MSKGAALSRTVLPVALFLAALLGPAAAMAEDEAAIEKMVQLNKRAMDDLDTADFAAAKKSLLEAEKIGKKAGLDTHPVMARTYVHLGALSILGYKDTAKSQQYFGQALEIQPDIKLDKNLNIAAVRDVFAAAQAKKGSGPAGAAAESGTAPEEAGGASGAGGPAGDGRPRRPGGKRGKSYLGDERIDPDLPRQIVALDCPFPDETPPGRKVTLRCVAAQNLGVDKVVLFYKGYEMDDYEELGMEKTPKGWWKATIPKKRIDGTSLQFYFEGLNAGGTPVVSNGRAESPNVMLLVEKRSDVVQGKVGEEEDENPLEEKSRFTPKLLLGKYDRSRLGVDPRFGNRRFWIGFGLGSGAAFLMNGEVEAGVRGYDMMRPNVDPISGFGWDGLGHLAPEIGVQFNPDWAVAIQGRHQWIPQDKVVARYTASGAHAAILRVIHYTKQQRFRGYFAGAAGFGEGIRAQFYTVSAMPKFKDTVLVGPYLVGGSAGMIFEIAERLSWVAEVNALVGFPNKGINFDINTGLQVNFGDTSRTAEEIREEKRQRQESVAGSADDEDPRD